MVRASSSAGECPHLYPSQHLTQGIQKDTCGTSTSGITGISSRTYLHANKGRVITFYSAVLLNNLKTHSLIQIFAARLAMEQARL